MNKPYPRRLRFNSIFNFRDLGGYQTRKGRTVLWRRIFRSGELHNMTWNDSQKLKSEIGLTSVLDLRSTLEIKQFGTGLVSESGFKYYNVSLISDGGDKEGNIRRYQNVTDMGQFYLKLAAQKDFSKGIVQSLEIIADPTNHPLVFHCSAGKDRTGVLAAILLNALEVIKEDIVSDFLLSAPYVKTVAKRIKSDPKLSEDHKSLPEYFWKVSSESMTMFLAGLKKEYGSTREYLQVNGAKPSLFTQLESDLLV